MHAKLVILVLALVAIGSALLVLRQQRYTLANELADLNRHYYQTQQQIWRAQAEAAAMTAPQALRRRIERARLALEPAVPGLPAGRPGPAWVYNDRALPAPVTRP